MITTSSDNSNGNNNNRNRLTSLSEIEIERRKAEFNFMRTYRGVLNYLLEEEISEMNKKIIISFTEKLYMNQNQTKEILLIIKYSLVESVFIRQSLYIRFLLKNIFKIEYDCSDLDIIETVIDLNTAPRIFSKENYYENLISLEDILNMPLKIKNSGELLSTGGDGYKTSYPFDSESAMKELNNSIILSGNLLIYENFFFMFSGLVDANHNTIEVLMNGDGIVPIPWRYFLAIMAVSTIQSYYLLIKLQEAFLLKGGEEDWLVYGLDSVPEKLQKLSRINNILAHQPWKMTTKDITELFTTKNGWNRDEFVHAALIFINYHRLAAVTESLKITFIENFSQLNKDGSLLTLDKQGKLKLYNNLIEMNEEDEGEDQLNTGSKMSKRKISGDDAKIGESLINLKNSETNCNNNDENKHKFDFYISNYCTLYLDFDFYSDIPLSNMNFNWNNEGLYILQNIYPKVVDSLNTEISFISELTSNTIGGDFQKLNTFHFRNSIRCYIEKIFGIVNEDYDYSKTNILLLKSTKMFIKNIACLPEKITKADFLILLNTFSIEEIFHLIIVVTANKAKAQLTFLSYMIYDIIKSID